MIEHINSKLEENTGIQTLVDMWDETLTGLENATTTSTSATTPSHIHVQFLPTKELVFFDTGEVPMTMKLQ
jgi:hypothetical protein